ncbi:hypothetical protein MP228_005943 [Amoeboaphelidium protococcarum]|nr:hypothetical protein MP228_005943 [Amoeboaphelidium protococcarum]
MTLIGSIFDSLTKPIKSLLGITADDDINKIIQRKTSRQLISTTRTPSRPHHHQLHQQQQQQLIKNSGLRSNRSTPYSAHSTKSMVMKRGTHQDPATSMRRSSTMRQLGGSVEESPSLVKRRGDQSRFQHQKFEDEDIGVSGDDGIGEQELMQLNDIKMPLLQFEDQMPTSSVSLKRKQEDYVHSERSLKSQYGTVEVSVVEDAGKKDLFVAPSPFLRKDGRSKYASAMLEQQKQRRSKYSLDASDVNGFVYKRDWNKAANQIVKEALQDSMQPALPTVQQQQQPQKPVVEFKVSNAVQFYIPPSKTEVAVRQETKVQPDTSVIQSVVSESTSKESGSAVKSIRNGEILSQETMPTFAFGSAKQSTADSTKLILPMDSNSSSSFSFGAASSGVKDEKKAQPLEQKTHQLPAFSFTPAQPEQKPEVSIKGQENGKLVISADIKDAAGSKSSSQSSSGFSFGTAAQAEQKAPEQATNGSIAQKPQSEKNETANDDEMMDNDAQAGQSATPQIANNEQQTIDFKVASSQQNGDAIKQTESAKAEPFGFKFGAGVNTDALQTGGFSFGSTGKTDSAPAQKPSFTFGAGASNTPASSTTTDVTAKPLQQEEPKQSGFSFGQSSTAGTQSGFQFGASQSVNQEPTAPVKFGQSLTTTAPSSTGFQFSFGSADDKSKASGTSGSGNGVVFGQSIAGQTPANGEQKSTPTSAQPAFSFGQSTLNNTPAISQNGFSFGSSSTQLNGATTNGAAADQVKPVFGFGQASSSNTAAPAQENASGQSPFTFGSSTNANQSASNLHAFGSVAPQAASTGFQFGAQTAQPLANITQPNGSSPFSFNTGAPQQLNASAGGFGSSAPMNNPLGQSQQPGAVPQFGTSSTFVNNPVGDLNNSGSSAAFTFGSGNQLNTANGGSSTSPFQFNSGGLNNSGSQPQLFAVGRSSSSSTGGTQGPSSTGGRRIATARSRRGGRR